MSSQWKALLHYRPTLLKNQSRAHHAEFFLSPNGASDLLAEYQANKQSFLSDKNYSCRFPARANILSAHLGKGEKVDLSHCLDLNSWMESLGHDEISVLFAGAYANNPASLFGHTFLKFSKKGRNPLLNYVVAFLARTDPRDSAPVYTWKGLTGGYLGFFEIEHFSMSIGLYNNSESRDLWEYSLPLNEDQRQLIAFHLWELIHHTGFPYYFSDENCSYLLLALIEVAMPEAALTANRPFFVMPIETVKTLKTKKEGVDYVSHRPSLQSQINLRLKNQDTEFVKDYSNIQKTYDLKHYQNDVQMLELLIDTYHLKNYKLQTKLSPKDQKFMYDLLQRRSQIDAPAQKIEKASLSRPDLSHAPHRLRSEISRELLKLELSYGLHRLIEPKQGYEDFSYIDFFVVAGSYREKEKSARLDRLSIVEISSWEPISLANASLSWQVTLQGLKDDQVFQTGSVMNLKGGPGLAYLSEQWGSALFLGADFKTIYRNQRTRALGYLEWQSFYRPHFLESISSALIVRHFAHQDRASTNAHLELAWHLDKDFSLSANGRMNKIAKHSSDEDWSMAVNFRF